MAGGLRLGLSKFETRKFVNFFKVDKLLPGFATAPPHILAQKVLFPNNPPTFAPYFNTTRCLSALDDDVF